MFTIEKGVPAPERPKYPFGEMEVGDSFHADNVRAVNAAHTYGRRFGKKFSARKNGSSYRVWRIA